MGIYILFITFCISCEEELIKPYPCIDGKCDATFVIDPFVSPAVYQDINNYWHIKHYGLNYFTIKGSLSSLNKEYIINGVPMVETTFDSNYWVWIENITFTIPVYSVLSWFTDREYTNPIPIGNRSYTLTNMANIFPPLNIAGYSINPHFCWECLYAKTLIGSHSKYTYQPQQQFFFDNEMVGDTAIIFIETIFNSELGPSEVRKFELNVIFED